MVSCDSVKERAMSALGYISLGQVSWRATQDTIQGPKWTLRKRFKSINALSTCCMPGTADMIMNKTHTAPRQTTMKSDHSFVALFRGVGEVDWSHLITFSHRLWALGRCWAYKRTMLGSNLRRNKRTTISSQNIGFAWKEKVSFPLKTLLPPSKTLSQ